MMKRPYSFVSDNVEAVKSVVPQLGGLVAGSTQVDSIGNVRNFGGFTDGDRAVSLALSLGASRVALAGMDFGGVVGSYSGIFGSDKVKKLSIGKRIVEALAGEYPGRLFNLTSGGEEIGGVARVSPERFFSRR